MKIKFWRSSPHNMSATVRLGKLVVSASRWPWQAGLGWRPHKTKPAALSAMLNDGSRFGAGWRYKLGFSIGGQTLLVDLLFGTLSFRWSAKPFWGEPA